MSVKSTTAANASPTTVMTTMAIVAESKDCARLREFKEFLSKLASDVGVSSMTAELRCMTRSSSETYPVSVDELNAEVTMTIWTQLQAKQCPRRFQLSLLRATAAAVERECRNVKECGLSCRPASIHLAEADALDLQQYDLAKLQKFVINNLEQLLTRLTDNAEAANLPNYADPNALCDGVTCRCDAEIGNVTPTYVVGCVKNKHRKMEDRNVCLERYGELYELNQPYSFYGVFDGHSGALAASYAVSQLPQLLAERLRHSTSNTAADVSATYREAFESAFLRADERFAQKRIGSGTTAVCALLAQTPGARHLYVAWVGDSKALLVSRGGISLQLVKPHKPDSPDERRRIEEGGAEACGAVMLVQGQWRVNGILNVSRSIGDFSVNAVIAEPDFVDVPLTAAHDFLVLATDGLCDHVDEATIVETIYTALEEHNQKLEDIPRQLVELAKQGDSQDNITVVVVFLKPPAAIVAERANWQN